MEAANNCFCPYCNGSDLSITTEEFHGEIFYLLHHSNYHSNRSCGFIAYDWDKKDLINSYTSNKVETTTSIQMTIF